MLEREDIAYSDNRNVGAKADFNNLETSITVYKNKRDERGIVVRNKARLVTQGHTQEEGIDYKKVFDPVARIEAIRLFLAYASFMGFMVYQMDVKSTFLYGTIEEEVYVCQPLGFEYPAHPDKVYKVVKALYGLHQAPRACLTRTTNYQPVTARNQSNPSVGFQGKFDAETAGEEANQQYVLFPTWSTGSSNPQNKEGDDAFDEKEHDAEKPESAVNLSPSSSALSGEQDDMTKKKVKGKSPIEYFTGYRDLNADFEDYSEDSSNDVSTTGPIVPTAGQNYSNSTNPFSADGPSNTNTSPIDGKPSLNVASKLFDNSDMLAIEDIAFSDHENVGVEVETNNLQTSITVSPIPITRNHKAHPIS
nr:putative ribonuclease H-like domain-containing protein [Tanacetum cinerariifolium]